MIRENYSSSFYVHLIVSILLKMIGLCEFDWITKCLKSLEPTRRCVSGLFPESVGPWASKTSEEDLCHTDWHHPVSMWPDDMGTRERSSATVLEALFCYAFAAAATVASVICAYQTSRLYLSEVDSYTALQELPAFVLTWTLLP